jgi:integrase
MGSARARKETGLLFFDFRYQGKRCREQTTLPDTAENRRNMLRVLKTIEAEITLGSFDYATYFPNSPNVVKVRKGEPSKIPGEGEGGTVPTSPLLEEFAWEWFHENTVRWKRSYREKVEGVLNQYLVPQFGEKEVSRINKGEVLKFRSSLAKVTNGSREGLSPDRINHIITPLRMMLADAADRYDFTTPFVGIKTLAVPRTDVDPFSFDEVEKFIAAVRLDFRNYYTVRFFTGLRTGEIDGLKWRYVDFDRREILVRETIVKGFVETAKTAESVRSVAMSSRVWCALEEQFKITGEKSEYVFCDRDGGPLDYSNVTQRVWLPTLEHLGLRRRRAYQTRHTTATLWLAAGENPEWIARQMGHTTTKMLFTVYSRFVPNLTRQDGSAFERLIEGKAPVIGGAP